MTNVIHKENLFNLKRSHHILLEQRNFAVEDLAFIENDDSFSTWNANRGLARELQSKIIDLEANIERLGIPYRVDQLGYWEIVPEYYAKLNEAQNLKKGIV